MDFQNSLKFLADDSDLLLAIVFGSGATGPMQPGSDVDVAVYSVDTMGSRRRQAIADRIASATGRPVDLVDLRTASGALLRQILKRGTILFSKKPGLIGSLLERLVGWQEDFEPLVRRMMQDRVRRFSDGTNGS